MEPLTKLGLARLSSIGTLVSALSSMSEAPPEDGDDEDSDVVEVEDDGSISTIENGADEMDIGDRDVSTDVHDLMVDPRPSIGCRSSFDIADRSSFPYTFQLRDDDADGNSSLHSHRRPSVRGKPSSSLRRSKSMPTKPSVSYAAPDCTPGKVCFSQDAYDTQTPLRIDKPKIFSGRDCACDWGSSQPTNKEAILKLQKKNFVNGNDCFASMTIGTPPPPQGRTMLSPSCFSPAHNQLQKNILSGGRKPCPSTFETALQCITPVIASIQNLLPSPTSLLPFSFGKNVANVETEFISADSFMATMQAVRSLIPKATKPSSSAIKGDLSTNLSTTSVNATNSSILSMTEDRRKARAKKSNAKWRRVSMALNTSSSASIRDTSLSPSAVDKKATCRSSSSSMEMTNEACSHLETRRHVLFYVCDVLARTELVSFTSQTFRGIVIGGTFQNCFEGGIPVVAPPTSAEKRVANVRVRPDEV